MEKSIVGDPILWPGLVYSPLNNAGVIFALGVISNSTGLIFEEFSDDGSTAVCRRKIEAGWERIRVAFAVRSSDYDNSSTPADLLVCWVDDASEAARTPRLVLANVLSQGEPGSGAQAAAARGLESILPAGAADDLLQRGQSRESYEQTIKQLDEQIKKLRNG